MEHDAPTTAYPLALFFCKKIAARSSCAGLHKVLGRFFVDFLTRTQATLAPANRQGPLGRQVIISSYRIIILYLINYVNISYNGAYE